MWFSCGCLFLGSFLGDWYLVPGPFRGSSLAVGCCSGRFFGDWCLVISTFRGGSLAVDFCSAAFWVFGEVFLLSHLVGDVRIVFFH